MDEIPDLTPEEQVQLRERQEKARAAADRARALADLAETPGWLHLRQVYEQAKERYFARLAKSLMAKGRHIDYESLAYNRGYFDCFEQLLANPERAEKKFEKALREVEALEEFIDEKE